MAEYKTPGVYVEEISTLPASIARVETAIPAFIGYTVNTSHNGKDLKGKAVRISSLLDYQEKFGGEPGERMYEVKLDASNFPQTVTVIDTDPATTKQTYYLYDSVRMFYANGGGDCYIVSVGKAATNTAGLAASTDVSEGDLKAGIDAIRKVDEPTLILFPDGINLSATDLGKVQVHALQQCASLQDRFGVFDVVESGDYPNDIRNFRNSVGVNDLKYGSAYTPYIHASLASEPGLDKIRLKDALGNNTEIGVVSTNPTAAGDFNDARTDYATVKAVASNPFGLFTSWEEYYSSPATIGTQVELEHYLTVAKLLGEKVASFGSLGASKLKSSKVLSKVNSLIAANGALETAIETFVAYDKGWDLVTGGGGAAIGKILATHFNGTHPYVGFPDYKLGLVVKDGSIYDTTSVAAAVRTARAAYRAAFENLLKVFNSILSTAKEVMGTNEGILRSTDPVYSRIIAAIKAEGLKMPPCGAIVGRFAEVDRTRGVWKAPANVSLNSVVGLSESVDDREQESINVDVTGGKSINVIRSFKGKGTLIWGARTLAGNDNEWRYVPVRRLFIMAEESIKKATEFVVFEPNDANTWGRVKAMIGNFLTSLWRDGALAGAKPEESYFVKVGLGQTMTAQDILEGRLIIEIGMAAVRPAEFIILRFMHKLQES